MTDLPLANALDTTDWQSRAAAHRARAERWTAPARSRRASHRPHPVEDFLFTYYPFSFAKLEEWHPPVGTALEVAPVMPACWRKAPYRSTGRALVADPSLLSEKQKTRLRWLRELLVATRDRPPILACHGLHEWAMVYRGTQVRHAEISPLRLPQEEIDALIESRPIRCSHFDAFRFFHADAQTLNRLQPTLVNRPDFEQSGCVHANMDLYKWAFKAMPWAGSDLLLNCFELALELRDLDMRASPYDLSAFGLQAIPIETADGRRSYEQEQARLATLARPLRQKLIDRLEQVIGIEPLSKGTC
ncbi:MAG: 3-methyladenine DNA glycosylase [Verrucomicrobia bacterium]|nr:MAG: 3-methyladenine DNA glycosylase [Verrucomicrobiota bacterium]TAE86346.1 MAG: 3-methyladenine DNA glycosylase [Verrucomicrobiota bacterium]TAF24369.1 MAG: 3-methyladenine DNA glycosylase [Verrucomicrobiota bacterium]